ncbi:FadR/GntR family transcriptional regulator [Mycolicibacterium sp. XJ1819]
MVTETGSTIIRVPKAGEIVAAQLRKEILTGQLRAGDMLPSERELIQRFGVSRPTLREAYLILQSEQMIEVRRGARGGARVTVPEAGSVSMATGRLLQYRGATVGDVHSLRTVLECTTVESLARNRSAEDLERLAAAVADGERFHRLLAELAGNPTVQLFLEMTQSIAERHNEITGSLHRPDRAYLQRAARSAQRAHTKLIELIRQKSADKAVALWKRHLASAAEGQQPGGPDVPLDMLG